MKRLTAFAVLMVLGLSSLGFAQVPFYPLPRGQIQDIQVWWDGSVHLTLKNSPDLCVSTATNGDKKRATIALNRPANRAAESVRSQLALLTAAKLAGKEVTLVNEATSAYEFCTVLHVIVAD